MSTNFNKRHKYFFCTPEQGRILTVAFSDVEPVMEWVRLNGNDEFEEFPRYCDGLDDNDVVEKIPAFNLQELRGLALSIGWYPVNVFMHWNSPIVAQRLIEEIERKPKKSSENEHK